MRTGRGDRLDRLDASKKKDLILSNLFLFEASSRSRRSPLPVRKVHTGRAGDTLPTCPGKPVNPATEPSAGSCRLCPAEAKAQRRGSQRQGQRKVSRNPGEPREAINPAAEPSAGGCRLARPKPKRSVQDPSVRGSARHQAAPAVTTALDRQGNVGVRKRCAPGVSSFGDSMQHGWEIEDSRPVLEK